MKHGKIWIVLLVVLFVLAALGGGAAYYITQNKPAEISGKLYVITRDESVIPLPLREVYLVQKTEAEEIIQLAKAIGEENGRTKKKIAEEKLDMKIGLSVVGVYSTDAQGKFDGVIPLSRTVEECYVAIKASRNVGDERELYFWCVPATAEEMVFDNRNMTFTTSIRNL